MYENIGNKIKGLATAIFIIGAIAGIALGICCFALQEDILIPIGVAFIVISPILSWVSSLLVYGFGELIIKTNEIAKNSRIIENTSSGQKNIDFDRIEKLDKLLSAGLITEEEYQQALSKK